MSEHLKQKNFEFEFTIGDIVMVDQDASIQMTITSIQVFPEGLCYKCSWFGDSGQPMEQLFDAFRIHIMPTDLIRGYYRAGNPRDRR